MIDVTKFSQLSRDEKRQALKATILELLKVNAEALAAAYEVGEWVWVQFEKKPSAPVLEVLKGLGFHWNKVRKAWQHPCGHFCRRSEDDPTEKYSVKKVA